MKTAYKIEHNGREYEVEHGDPFDRGMSDSYYSRRRYPHKGGVGGASGPRREELTADEVIAYHAGYNYNEADGDKKNWD